MEFDATRPIWLQLVAEFSRRIAVGLWPPGHRIPGVRDLAAELNVNPNTVQRSLAELERQSLCYTDRTAGRYVTDETSRIRTMKQQLAEQAAQDFITTARGFGLELADVRDLISNQWPDKDAS